MQVRLPSGGKVGSLQGATGDSGLSSKGWPTPSSASRGKVLTSCALLLSFVGAAQECDKLR